jgi:hypothetical protein
LYWNDLGVAQLRNVIHEPYYKSIVHDIMQGQFSDARTCFQEALKLDNKFQVCKFVLCVIDVINVYSNRLRHKI